MELDAILTELETLAPEELYERDFTVPAGKTDRELSALFAAADALAGLRARNYDVAVFRSGLALWEGREEPGYAAFAAAAAMMGLRPVRLETVTAETLAAAAPDVLCAVQDRGALCDELYRQGVLDQRPLSLPRDTGLPLLLAELHACGGMGELRRRGVRAAGGEGDLPELLERFGLERAGDQAEDQAEEAGALQAESLRPYLLAGMILLGKCPQPVKTLRDIRRAGMARRSV